MLYSYTFNDVLFVCMMLSLLCNFWQEPDLPDGLEDEKKASLLMMNFSRDEVEFAMNRLGRLKFLDIHFTARGFSGCQICVCQTSNSVDIL